MVALGCGTRCLHWHPIDFKPILKAASWNHRGISQQLTSGVIDKNALKLTPWLPGGHPDSPLDPRRAAGRKPMVRLHAVKPAGPAAGFCLYWAIWRCRKPFSQWQHSFQMKATLPLAKRIAIASRGDYKADSWEYNHRKCRAAYISK